MQIEEFVQGWNRKYDEYLYITSKRLAPFGTYTKRMDIPKYYMCPHANQMYGHIIENGGQQQELQQQLQQQQDIQEDHDGEEEEENESEDGENEEHNDE